MQTDAYCILDLLAPSRVTIPGQLSHLMILNLAHNKVPTDTFVTLMQETLEAEVQLLTQRVGSKAMLLLWRTVKRVGIVAKKRVMQHTLGTARSN